MCHLGCKGVKHKLKKRYCFSPIKWCILKRKKFGYSFDPKEKQTWLHGQPGKYTYLIKHFVLYESNRFVLMCLTSPRSLD